jgi:hypothetical protein
MKQHIVLSVEQFSIGIRCIYEDKIKDFLQSEFLMNVTGQGLAETFNKNALRGMAYPSHIA